MRCCNEEAPSLFGEVGSIDPGLVPWLLREAHARGIRLEAVRREGDSWVAHEPDGDPGGAVRITQRPACSGVRSAVVFTDGDRVTHAWTARLIRVVVVVVPVVVVIVIVVVVNVLEMGLSRDLSQ